MSAAIQMREIGKKYRIGERERYKALRDSLTDLIYAPTRTLRRHQRPERANESREFWALRDVSLDIDVGEVVGIIGRNGAGKSTLLKLLARVTEPSAGRILVRGRVGSLLEVGTGFHPELTGRENAYLSGAILGMRRAEIKRKFDDIVAFAEVERFVDTPVKHYSSGMYMRLAFAVAAHLETEILLIDEVLAVGDAAFQRRCMGKMGDVARQGRTVLFVSHNMTAINQLCPRSVLLADGAVALDGPTATVVPEYLRVGAESSGERVWPNPTEAPGGRKMRLHAVRVVSGGLTRGIVNIDEETTIEVDYWNLEAGARNICANIYLLDANGTTVFSTASTPAANALPESWFGRQHPHGLFRSKCTIPANFLNEGMYYVSVFLLSLGPLVIEARAPEVVGFTVFDTGAMREPGGGAKWDGVIRVRLPWTTEFLGEQSEIARAL